MQFLFRQTDRCNQIGDIAGDPGGRAHEEAEGSTAPGHGERRSHPLPGTHYDAVKITNVREMKIVYYLQCCISMNPNIRY